MPRSSDVTRLISIAAVALAVIVAPAAADWSPGDGNKMHFPQLPDTNGFDVNFTGQVFVADDWQCTETGPVKDIHFWFSAESDWFDISLPLNQQIFDIHVVIFANIPASAGGPPYSMPGALLWQRHYTVDEVKLRVAGGGDQWWFNPASGVVTANDHQRIYQCNVVDIDQPFYQKRGEIYWLAVTITAEAPMGWKTADLATYPLPYTGGHFEDDAVWGNGVSWQELFFPAGPNEGKSMDLAFVINGSSIKWNHKMHFPQPPDPTGADVFFTSPFVLADDWTCSESGAVKDIHYWFSAMGDWLVFDEPLNLQLGDIHLSIHEDIPDPDGGGPLYSMPGPLLWERDFPIDSVVVSKCYTPGQDFYYPELGEYFPDDHACMYRVDVIDIQDPFIQEEGRVYWLDVWMTGQGPLGWKTADVDRYPGAFSGVHYLDDAVWGIQEAFPDWQELIWPAGGPKPGQSIDLAFVITKDWPTGVNDGATPQGYRLEQNYPNPFNPTTTIAYTLPQPSDVTLAIFDVTGALVRVLYRGTRPQGTFEATWDARDASGNAVASGVYFYRLTAGTFEQTKKMVLFK